ncbi:MAG: 6-hydroxymethylpterin diphosphokinase MptE-like protein [Alkalispirochaeta sp.]
MDETSLRIERRSGPGGAVIYAEGRPLTGPDPASSMQRRLPGPDSVSPQTLFLVLSPLDGFGLEEWASRLPITCGVLIVELNPELARLRPEVATWNDHRHVISTDSWDASVLAADRLIHGHAARRVQTIHLTGGTRLHRQRYRQLEERVNQLIQRFWNNRGTQIRLQRRWVANLIRNPALDGNSLETLRSRGGDRAILVGAGPSLDTHIPLLARMFPTAAGTDREGGILVAIDTALPALAAADIQPDFIVTMDSQLANAQDFLPWRWDRTAVIADATTHFSIPRRFPSSRRYWFVSRFSEVQLFSDPELRALFRGIPVIPPFGSVAPSAVHILSDILEVAEIILVGIDFWYRPPRTHARMSTSDRWLKKATSRTRHRDGHDRALARPFREVQLKDQTQTWGDAILFDQAQLARETISRMSARVFQVCAPGLDVGAETILVEHVDEWWASGETGASGKAADDDPHRTARIGALHALLRRLRTVEARLQRNDDSTVIDSGLDFVLVDLPQWPLMTLSPEWMHLHRLRILRSVRDYRRRVETLLFRSSAQD